MKNLSSALFRLRWLVLGVSVVIAALAAVLGLPVLGQLGGGNPDFVTPGSSSQQATARIEAATGTVPDGGLIVLVDTGQPVDDPETAGVLDEVVAALQREPAVAGVTTPETSGPRQVARDGGSAYVVGLWDADATDRDVQGTIDRLQESFEGREDVLLGGSEVVGNQVVGTVVRDLARAELLAFPVLLVVSLLVFRGLVAAVLPLILGGLNIVLATVGLRLVNEWVDMSIFAMNLVTALGLGLAIDYSLLMISRFRTEIAVGRTTQEALGVTMSTAGRTVLLSAVTVAAAMACLFVFDQRFLYSMATGGVLVSVSGALAALVVLPALLAVLGPRVNALAPRRWRRHLEGEHDAGAWFRICRSVVRRPALTAAVGVLVVLALAAPLTQVAFTAISAKDVPSNLSARQVDDHLATNFDANPREDVVVVVEAAVTDPAVASLADQVGDLPGGAEVLPPVPLGEKTSLILVDPQHEGMDGRSVELVQQIRYLDSAQLPVRVGGESANFLDLRSSIVDDLPLAIVLVIVGTLIVLWLLTGSVLLPALAVVMNTLTLAATYGILVLIFQDGHLAWAVGASAQGALDVTMPVLLFALVFGLSTDYGVFLLARMREAREHGASDRESIVLGVGRTGPIVTAAAVLFCIALGALVTSDIVFIKELGLGTALGVLLDATVVRILLVPSLMALFGSWTWWSPRMFAGLHGRIGIRESSMAGESG